MPIPSADVPTDKPSLRADFTGARPDRRGGTGRRSSRLLRLAVPLLLATMVAAGCTGGSDEKTWPLTGLPGYSPDAGTQVVTVKIDNTSAGRPQVGLDQADLVVQEMVEGGTTRLAAMFHAHQPTSAGAVRSLRETDIGLVLPTGGTLAASGGAAGTIAAVTAAGVPIAVEGGPGFSRDSSRKAPYNVMLDVAELAGTLGHNPPPAAYLPFGDVPEGAGGQAAQEVELTWPADTERFTYDSGSSTWDRADVEGAGTFTSVVALFLPVTFAGQDSSGAPIPTMLTEGEGPGTVLTGGQSYSVKWAKSSPSSPWTFTITGSSDASGDPFTIPPGRTWLALLPTDGGEVNVR